MPDKYKATWVSHSSIADFLKCPRLYYLRNVYKDPRTGNKITVMKPALALGQIVHDVIEELSILPVDERLSVPLEKKYDVYWKKVTGKLGGFTSESEESEYKDRGKKMLLRVEKNPGPILKKAVKIKQDLPHYYLNEEENIILCGKIDWLQWNEEDDSVNILDFKTGKNEEDPESLQLPIYHLLVANTQGRDVAGVSYWYLEYDDTPVTQALPDLDTAHKRVFEVAKRIKLARQIKRFKCPHDGCFACRDLERVFNGEGEKVGVSEYRQDIYIL